MTGHESALHFDDWRSPITEQWAALALEVHDATLRCRLQHRTQESPTATAAPRVLAGVIGQLATHELTDPITIDANYVRRSDAELNWTDR